MSHDPDTTMPRINAVSFHENRGIEAICRTVKRAGFDSLELSRPPFYDKLSTAGTRRRFADWAADLGLRLYGFDCWVEVDPYEKFDETLTEFQRAVDWAADLDLGLIISHDPWVKVNAGRGADICLKTCLKLFRRVADLCAQRELRLVFEPHPDTLSMDNNWAIDFVDALTQGHAPSSIGILYDCCHYGVGQPQTGVDSLDVLGPRVLHVHFSDGDKQTYALHLPPGDGQLDLDGIVAALKRIVFSGTLTCDMYGYPLPEDGARRCASRIVELELELKCIPA